MRLLIVILNKLVRIISRRNRLVSKIALGDHLVGWSNIRGLIFRSLRGDLVCIFVFLTRARARRVFRAREGFGDISGMGGLRPTILRFSKNVYFCADRKVSIPSYAGGRPVLRNICKIAKFVDTAENESKEAFLI